MGKVVLKVIIFNIIVIAFYTYVGQIIPQVESHPPEATTISADMAPAELAKVGEEIFYGKGTCALCHSIGAKGERCPDLAGIGQRAATRQEGVSKVDYLAESLYNPSAFVVEGWQPIMPVINKAPINLTDDETHAVVAFLETLGGEATVKLDTKFAGATASASAAPAKPMQVAGGDLATQAKSIIAQGGCTACHSFDSPQRLLGPSLFDMGKRQKKAYILESIVDPDAVIAPGAPPYPPGLMKGTLTGNGFYEKMTLANLNTLVAYLSSLQGQ